VGHLIIMLMRCGIQKTLLRRWCRRVTLWTGGVSVGIVLIPSDTGILIIPPLVICLVGLLVVVGIVAAIRIVLCIIVRVIVLRFGVATMSLVEFVTILLLLLWISVVIFGVRIVTLCVLSVCHRSGVPECEGQVKKKGWEEVFSDRCSRQLRSNLIGTAPHRSTSKATTCVNNSASSFFQNPSMRCVRSNCIRDFI
jgi:hypothetical protein